jgi:hypothetical protein
VNSLVACAAICRIGSFRSSQQYRFLQASAFGVAVNRRSVLPDDGHDETCVGRFFAVFRHRDKSSAPLRVMGRLARLQRTNLQVTIGWCKANVGPRAVSSRHIPARKDAEGPAAFRCHGHGLSVRIWSKFARACDCRHWAAGQFAALDAFHSEESMFLSKRYWINWVRSSGDASVVEHHH